MYAEDLVEDPRHKLCYLVEAGNFKIAAVDVFPKAAILHLVQPTRKVGYESSLGSRQVKDKHQRPQNAKHSDPLFLRGIFGGHEVNI